MAINFSRFKISELCPTLMIKPQFLRYNKIEVILVFEILSKISKFAFIFLIYYFLLNFLRIMKVDLEEEKINQNATGFVLVEENGKAYPLFNINTIGRANDADIVIEDPFISSKHALIEKRGSRMIIQDLNSTNGTFVNGKRIRKPVRLKENDQIALGKKNFTFLRGERLEASR